MAGAENDRDTITIESSPGKISEVDDFLENWLRRRGVPESTVADMAIAVTELVNNAIRHGNREKSDKIVTVDLRLEGIEIEASISDEGQGFDPDNLPDPLAEENLLKEIGRGIFIVKSLMDQFEYSFVPDRGATIRIVKRLDKTED
jgi:serine/threonine-protein kinase RsbW